MGANFIVNNWHIFIENIENVLPTATDRHAYTDKPKINWYVLNFGTSPQKFRYLICLLAKPKQLKSPRTSKTSKHHSHAAIILTKNNEMKYLFDWSFLSFTHLLHIFFDILYCLSIFDGQDFQCNFYLFLTDFIVISLASLAHKILHEIRKYIIHPKISKYLCWF